MSSFVSVGNATQPFERLLQAVCLKIEKFPRPLVIQAGSTSVACDNADLRSYVRMDEFECLVAGAQLVVMHAGAGSVIHAVRAGKVPVVMPRRAKYGEHVDDHQVEFALQLGREGLLVVAEEPAELDDAIVRAMAMQKSRMGTLESVQMLKFVGETLNRYASISKL